MVLDEGLEGKLGRVGGNGVWGRLGEWAFFQDSVLIRKNCYSGHNCVKNKSNTKLNITRILLSLRLTRFALHTN